jgi:hypothetical protein
MAVNFPKPLNRTLALLTQALTGIKYHESSCDKRASGGQIVTGYVTFQQVFGCKI